MPARNSNHAIVYLRRSTDRQEISLSTQLEWAITEAKKRSLTLDATHEDLAQMRSNALSKFKAIRLDDGISGADLERPGFQSLITDARKDRSISHILIYRRDRFARPEDSIKLVAIEKDLRLAGLTMVFADDVGHPLERGKADLAADVAMMLSYYESGEFLRKHAERVLQAQRQLALGGYRVGGSAPYGFARVLVDSAGNVIEELTPGRQVRQPGCHVKIVPKDESKIAVWITILDLKHQGWGFKRIAQYLNGLGIPSPGAGAKRTDQGVKHKVSGRWGPNTVKELCENRAILGIQDYGRRSEGSQRRLAKDGHRLLTETDRDPIDRPRVVKNEASIQIVANSGDPRYEPAKWDDIQRQLAARGKSQRGVPRTRDPARFPLACRIVDMTDGCGAIMYGYKHGHRPVYVCGSYMRTAGAECEHNVVDGEAALRFTLSALRQLVGGAANREKLRQILEERAQRDATSECARPSETDAFRLETDLGNQRENLATVQRRMATEADDDRYEALCTVPSLIGFAPRSNRLRLNFIRCAVRAHRDRRQRLIERLMPRCDSSTTLAA
jgi:DNA invertase Pin-like site-specific DNA recombinase